MPNQNAPRGFAAVSLVGAQAHAGSIGSYKIASGLAATIGRGDLVKLLNTGYITLATPGDRVLGIFQGVKYVGADGTPVTSPKWTSGTATFATQDAEAMVVDDPNVIVEARFTNSAAAMTQASVGNTFSLFAGTPDALGNSTQGVDASTVNATTLKELRFLGLSTRADSDPASAYAIGRFAFMNHELKAVTGV